MIYLDNAATTFYKPESVYQAVADTMRYKGVNVGRGGYRLAIEASDLVYQCRENLGRLFHTDRTGQNASVLPRTRPMRLIWRSMAC